MAIRNIRTDDDPILRKLSREVTKFGDRNEQLIKDMYETMDVADGVGLAAPQIGILKKIVTVDDREGVRFYMINPEIVEKSGSESGIEGCLSLPGKQGAVKRATHVVVNYQDNEGNKKELVADGFLARIMQHEIDHLDGILYSDRADEMYDVTGMGEK